MVVKVLLASREHLYRPALERKQEIICNGISCVITQLGSYDMEWLVHGTDEQLQLFDFMVTPSVLKI
jgi:hypothetical protein